MNLNANKNVGAQDPSGDSNNCPDCIGDPIIGPTGNNYLPETDYTGAGPFPLVFTRFYNSSSVNAGVFGANWSDSFAVDLKVVSSTSVQMFRADQKSYTFNLTGGVWQPDADVDARLIQTSSGWQYTTGLDETEYYDANGRLLARANRAGLKQNFTYDAQGRLVTVSDPLGRTLKFTYDGKGRISTMVDPAGGLYSYGYDTADNLVSITWPDGSIRKYVYGNSTFPHGLTGIIDENGNRFSTYTYDAQGRAISSEHAGGVDKLSLDYSNISTGFLVVTNTLGLQRHSFYESILGVARTDSIGNTCPSCSPYIGYPYSIMTHDANGNVASYIDPNGNTTTYSYDLTRNLETSRTLPDGTSITTTWDPNFRLPATITEPNRTTSFTYDKNGDLLSKTITAGNIKRTWSYTYNSNGQVLTRNGPRTDVNDVATLTYDSKGNLSTFTDALSHVTKITSYDANGRPLTIQDPNGLVSKLTYDGRGRITSLKVGSEVTTYSYDPAGELVKVTLPDGSYIAYSYDAAHELTGMADALGDQVVYTLDAMGNRVKEQTFDPSKTLTKTRSHVYDALSRLYQDIGAQNQTTSYAYDNNNNLTEIDQPGGSTSLNSFDSLNRLIYVIDPGWNYRQFSYDTNSRLSSVTDPLYLVTTYGYNGLDDPTSTQSPQTGATTKTFDAAGNVLSSTDARGDKTTYTYDALNRTTSTTFADGKTIAWQYDHGTNGIGHLTKMTDPSGSTTWSYNIYGRVVQKVQSTGSVTLTTKYAYNSAGQLVSMTYPSGKQLTYGYDKDGRVDEIDVGGTPIVSSVAYQPFGPVAFWLAGNGGTYGRTFNQDGRISNITITGNNTNETINFTYDSDGYVTTIADSKAATPNLKAVATTYGYDYSSEHLTDAIGAASVSYTCDANGNTTSDSVHTFTYDARGRLVKVKTGTVTASYAINGLGRRVAKTVSGASSEEFVYDEAGRLIGEYDGAGGVIEETVWLGNLPVGVLNTAGIYYINPDYLGAPQSITDQNDKTVWRWVHDPFGNGQPTGAFTYNLRFPGQYYDAESGLYYNMARDYSPALGRYIQSDPIGLMGGTNTYAYAKDDPIDLIDSEGLNPQGTTYPPENQLPLGARKLLQFNRNMAYNMTQKDLIMSPSGQAISVFFKAALGGLLAAMPLPAMPVAGQIAGVVGKAALKYLWIHHGVSQNLSSNCPTR